MSNKRFANAGDLAKYIMQISNKETIKEISLKQLKENIEIKLVDFGIAYAYDNIIEINRKLLQYPELLKEVLMHEIEHIEKPSFFDTFKIEIKDAFNLKKQRLMSFCLRKHPLMKLQSSLPIWYSKGEFSYNAFLLVFYTVSILILFLAINLFF